MKKLLLALAFIFAVMPVAFATTPEGKGDSAVIKVTNDNYNALTKQHKLLVVDFWAPWCPPCRALGPHIEALATEYAGKVGIGKCNVDENRELTNQFGISSIPAIFFIKNGKIVDKQIGYCEKNELKAKIEKWK
jgi:thioredoxin 1